MGKGSGFGKVILFGEHFVVYGVPSIVSAIDRVTTATVKSSEGESWSIDDNREATPGYKEEKLEQQKDSTERILKTAGIDLTKNHIKITLGGDLVAASGIGASAASCAAIARALSDEFDLDLSDERINELAYEGERGYHGTPSGIDNTAATYGGLIWFVKGEPNVIERIELREPIEIVMGNTGLVADTKAAIAGVRGRKEKNPEKYDKFFKEADDLAHRAKNALENLDLKAVGEYMNENHRLLQEIEVSCKELDSLVDLAREQGALGAKMTGGGLGGNMVALTPGDELQEKVALAMEEKGFDALRTRIG
ncbi:MAG: mevalonate kinase [Candidatus Hadarchaeota archaeon]|nr:mevalonate kinase [Candidatus Hadarchaeota archaeon]